MKRAIAILLLLCMILPFAACGKKTEKTDPAPAQPTQSTEPEKTYLPFVKPGEDNKLTIGVVLNTLCTDYETNALTQWIEKETGLDLEFRVFTGTHDEAATQIGLMIAANEKLPDVLYYWTGLGSEYNNYGMDGYFVDISQYYNDPDLNHFRDASIIEQFPGEEKMVANYAFMNSKNPADDKLYTYPCINRGQADPIIYPTLINKDWLTKLGLQMPTTPDELYNVLVAFRDKDPNGNGKKDEIPMIGIADKKWFDVVQYLINAYIYCTNLYDFNVKDGQIYVPYTTEQYREGLKFVNKLVKEGLLNTLTWTISDRAELVNLINPADDVQVVGVTCGHPSLLWLADTTGVYHYTPLGMLKDASGKGLGGYGPRQTLTISKYHFITKDCKNPELAYKFLDFLMSTEAYLHYRIGEEGVDWRFANPGELTESGEQAFYARLTLDDGWALTNNTTWHIGVGLTNSWYLTKVPQKGDPFVDAKNEYQTTLLTRYAEAGLPSELCYNLVYTAEEDDERSDFVSDLTTYISKSRSEFCNGILDPNSDKDWNAYLDNCKNLKVDRWVAIAQAAYDRQK